MTTDKMIRDLEATKKSFEGKFVGTGEVNVAWMIEDIIKFIKSQETNAELGRAVEKAFAQDYALTKQSGVEHVDVRYDDYYAEYTYDVIRECQLLEWAKEVENESQTDI
jgi:hypothetical protein